VLATEPLAVGAAGDQDQLLPVDRVEPQRLAEPGLVDDAEVDGAGLDAREHLVGGGEGELERSVSEAIAQERIEDVAAECAHRGHAHRIEDLRLRLADRRHQLGEALEELARQHEQPPADSGQREVGRAALDEPRAQLLLQLSDLVAHSRLAEMQPPRGAAESALGGRDVECVEVAGVEVPHGCYEYPTNNPFAFMSTVALSHGMRCVALCLVTLGGCMSSPAPTPASALPAAVARLVLLRPHSPEFEDGYRRHLEWHRRHADPWTWRGWTVVTGPRLGTFMDGTFGRTWDELDRAVSPAEDRADNDINVTPHADWLWHRVLVQRWGRLAPDHLDAAWLEMATIQPVDGRRADLERAALALFDRPGDDFAWFEVASGGGGESILLVARAGWRDVRHRAGPLPLPRGIEPEAAADLLAAAGHVESELLRYRPDLSYLGPAGAR